MKKTFSALLALTLLAVSLLPLSAAEPEVLTPRPLSSYPRPTVDTGMGLHWFPVTGGWTHEQVDFYIDEMNQMGITWVKVVTGGGPQEEAEYLVRKLAQNDIMPVIRIYGRSSDDNGDMTSFVRRYVGLGARYFEFYNEPGIEEPETSIGQLMDRWMARARETQRAGGIPVLTSLFPSNDPTDEGSYDAALRYLKDNGGDEIFRRGAAVSVHNYLANHPLDYPNDPVHQSGQPLSSAEARRFGISEAVREIINERQAADKRPGTTVDDDFTGFRMFETMESRFVRVFGYSVPMVGTEGGATVGEVDSRYPKVDEALQAELTVAIADYMVSKAPSSYFVTMNWLIGNAVMGHPTFPTWEDQAWYRPDRQMPVVGDLKKRLAAKGWDKVKRNPFPVLPTTPTLRTSIR